MAFLLLVVSVLYIYSTFKIDIVLWYRSAFHTAQAPDGKSVWWSLGGKASKLLSIHLSNLFKCSSLNVI